MVCQNADRRCISHMSSIKISFSKEWSKILSLKCKFPDQEVTRFACIYASVLLCSWYGHVSPKTSGGRVFCIFFAAMGLPFFGILFNAIGKNFADLYKKLEEKLKKRGEKRKKLRVGLCLLSCLIVFGLLIPASIFMSVEGWTYQEAFYYSFITLSTIGFGDFVVGNNPDVSYWVIYRIFVYFWIILGLAFMSAAINIFRKMIQKNIDENGTCENSSKLLDENDGDRDTNPSGQPVPDHS